VQQQLEIQPNIQGKRKVTRELFWERILRDNAEPVCERRKQESKANKGRPRASGVVLMDGQSSERVGVHDTLCASHPELIRATHFYDISFGAIDGIDSP